ncbi:MAG: transketolase, partial [Planctomycetota bacterium]
MRNAFRDAVYEWAKRDERVVLLSADIGNRMFDAYKTDFPDRFYNVGVAEQNMIGLASGLAMSGLRPVCYTIANFTTYR